MVLSPVYGIVLVALLLALGVYAWYTRHPTVADVVRGKIALPAAEVETLEALLKDAGVPPRAVRVVEVEPDIPCWSHAYRNRLDHKLRVDRQFGRYGDNGIGIDRGQVISLSLVETQLTDMTPLARLPALRHLQLRDARLASLGGLPPDCSWTHLVLSQNALTDLTPVAGCTALTVLDAAFNQIAHVPPLQALDRLERLDLRANRITDLAWLTGHPSVRHLELYGNRLTTPAGLADLPRLEHLELSGVGLTTLQGLRNLPALRTLYAASNQLQTVEIDVLAALPALRRAALDNNHIKALPAGYTYTGQGYGRFTIHPEGGSTPAIGLTMNPVADVLRAQAPAAHDSRQVHPVDRLPRGRGRAQGTRSRGRAGGLLSASVAYEGAMDWLDGAHTMRFNVDRALGVTVTASVEKGRLRIYLADAHGGYYYAEGIPGKSIAMSGMLITGTASYLVLFESVGGRAEGIAWTVKG